MRDQQLVFRGVNNECRRGDDLNGKLSRAVSAQKVRVLTLALCGSFVRMTKIKT